MDVVNHLLAHQLSSNDALLHNFPHIKQLLAQRIIQQAEQEEGLAGPVLHRWNLRLASLIAPSVLPPLRMAGFELLHLTFSASTTSLLSQGKATIGLALNVLTSNKSDPAIFVAALELVRLILAKSTWHAEWARDVAGAAVVQRTVNALVAAANGEVEEVKPACLNAIVSLLPLFPTPLRPLAPSLHTLAIALISQPGASRANIDAGSHLFVSLYLLAPKGRDGLREAWKKGAEALVGSIDSLVPVITSDIFAEDPLTNHTLAPLALPPLADNSPVSALVRIEALSQALALLLRTPTVERVGSVEVPVGALVELGVRLVGLNTETPIKERVDPSTVTLSLSLLPRLQIIGCQLLAQLGLAVGTPLVSHASDMLGTISRTLSTYPLRSPMRASLSTTYSLLLTSLGASLDPEEGKKSLARVWRCVLEDISAVAVEPVTVAASTEGADGKGGRKNKKQKTTYDPSESFEKKRAAVEEMDLAIAERALATLERLLLAPASHFLPPKLQLSTSRLLLFLALDPSFFSTHPLPSTSTSTFFPATSASSGVDIARQSAAFRRGVVKALKALAELGGNAAGGTLERAAEVWRRGCLDGDEEIKHLSITALASLSSLIHPILPPQQLNTTFARQKAERVGGFAGVGDEQDLEAGAREFAPRQVKRGRESEEEGMEVDDEDDEEEEEVKRSLVAQTKATSISSKSGAGQDGQGEKMVIEEEVTVVKPSTTSSFGTAAGFASFAAVKKVETVAPAAVEEDEDSSDEEAEVPAFVEAVLPAVASGGAAKGGDDDEDSSDDDEAMPTIHMDSDEE